MFLALFLIFLVCWPHQSSSMLLFCRMFSSSSRLRVSRGCSNPRA